MTAEQRVGFNASDGAAVQGYLARVPGAQAGAVVCHPHPDYGGSMEVEFVRATAEALAVAGFTTLRFDFRRPGTIEQRRTDLAGAVDALESPRAVLAGWSFGADLALWHASGDDRVVAVAAVAPPLSMLPAEAIAAVSVPALVLSPSHDQYCPPEKAAQRAPNLQVEPLPGCDHFLGGREPDIARRILDWLNGLEINV